MPVKLNLSWTWTWPQYSSSSLKCSKNSGWLWHCNENLKNPHHNSLIINRRRRKASLFVQLVPMFSAHFLYIYKEEEENGVHATEASNTFSHSNVWKNQMTRCHCQKCSVVIKQADGEKLQKNLIYSHVRTIGAAAWPERKTSLTAMSRWSVCTASPLSALCSVMSLPL